MEKCGNPEELETNAECALAACSACAGHYEDPDRTAWNADESEQADEGPEVLEAEKARQSSVVDRSQLNEL